MKTFILVLSLLHLTSSFAQTRTHPGGPDPFEFKRCPDAIQRADEFHVAYLKANKKDFKPAKDELQRMTQFEEFIGVQSLKLELKKIHAGSLAECDPAPSSSENQKNLEQLISIYEGNKRCLEFNDKEMLLKQMKAILKHERRN